MENNRKRVGVSIAVGIIVLAILILPLSKCFAQTRIEGQFVGAASQGLGYKGPQFGAGVRSVGKYTRWGTDFRLLGMNAPKLQTGDGIVIQGHALARYYVRPQLYAGGGMWFGKARTSDYSKLDGAVMGTAGWQRDLYGFEGSYRHGLNENRQRIVSFGGDVPVVRKGSCYVLAGGEVLNDRYVNNGVSRTGIRGEFRLSGGCFVGGK